jgi:hypothetical protein
MPLIDQLCQALGSSLPTELIIHVFTFIPLLELSELGANSYLIALIAEPSYKFPFASSSLERISQYTFTTTFIEEPAPPPLIYFLSPGLFEYLLDNNHTEFMEVLRYVSPTFSGIGILESDYDTPLLGLLAHYNCIDSIKLLIQRNLLDDIDLVQLLLIAASRDHVELFVLLDGLGVVHKNSLKLAAASDRYAL